MTTVTIMALLLSAGAAWMDLRCTKVDNGWLLFWLVVSLAVQLYSTGPTALRQILPGLILPVILLFPFFLFRMLGAGDIKVLAVLGSMMGARSILFCMFFSFLIGAIFSILWFLKYGGFRERLSYFLSYMKNYAQTGIRTPYVKTGAGISDEQPVARPENLRMTIPIFLAVLLWAAGLY